MKIIAGKYREEENIDKYLSFISDASMCCSLVFLWRLAAYARDNGHSMTGIIGRRDFLQQQQLWDKDLKENEGKPSGKVAKPLTSWHEFGCAVDLAGAYWKEYATKHWIPYSRLNQELNNYGLMLPLNKVDSPNVLEWWHLQPIETNGIPQDKRKDFLDKDDLMYRIKEDKMTVTEFQHIVGLTVDGVVGTQTKTKAKEVLQVCQEILGLNYSTAEEVINACMSSPDMWLTWLKNTQYADSFVMNIVDKMGGKK